MRTWMKWKADIKDGMPKINVIPASKVKNGLGLSP